MMRDTPRTFVGTVAFRLDGPIQPAVVGAALSVGLELVPGVQVAELDVAAGILVVIAERPADRGDVVAALSRLGCPVSA
jgi:hypothetical protein